MRWQDAQNQQCFEVWRLPEFGNQVAGDKGRIDLNAIAKEAELVEICQNDIWKSGNIAVELFLVFWVVEVARKFCLYVSDDKVFAIPNAKIRVACLSWFWQNCNFGFASLLERKI